MTKTTAANNRAFGSSLTVCINDYIDDANVKRCAKLAAWLGNDETHYIRRWEDKDIVDLKRLVHLTVNFVDTVLVADEYYEDMDGPDRGSGDAGTDAAETEAASD